MPDTAKYEAYRIQQPVLKSKTQSLFRPEMPEAESRVESIKKAIEVGRQNQGVWVAGGPETIPKGISFQVGQRELIESYAYDAGKFRPKSDPGFKVTNVFIDYPTGVMLIRRDKGTPSPFLVAHAFKQWLEQANEERQSGFDTIVQPIPLVEDFLLQLRNAETISRLSFVVHGPNPADEGDIVNQLAKFTQEHGIQNTTVGLYAQNIDSDTAQQIAIAAGKLGDSVSATIADKNSVTTRNIRMKKRPRSIAGPKAPTTKDGRKLLDHLKAFLQNLGVGKDEGD